MKNNGGKVPTGKVGNLGPPPMNEYRHRALVLERHLQEWGPICTGYDGEPHYVEGGNSLTVVFNTRVNAPVTNTPPADTTPDEYPLVICRRCLSLRTRRG